MRILIDGDAFPDISLIVALAKKYKVEVIIYVDSEHEFEVDAKVVRVAKGFNAVDTVIENEVKSSDIVLTQDYGVAVISLGKGAKCINQLGYFYDNNSIDYLLEIKNQNRKLRKHGHVRGPKARTKMDTERLLFKLEELIRGDDNE